VPAAITTGAGIVKARWLFQGQEIIGIGYPNAPQLIAPTMGLAAADNVGSTLIWTNWSSPDCNGVPSGGVPSLGDFTPMISQFGCLWGGAGTSSYTVGFKSASLSPPVPYVDQPGATDVTWPSWDATNANPTPTRVRGWVQDQLENQPGDYDVLRPWIDWSMGVAGAPDPAGVSPNHPGIPFPGVVTHWEDKQDDFPQYGDLWEYWHGAADIIRKADNNEEPARYEKCEGRNDDNTYYWDNEDEAIVVVSDVGNILTYFKPSSGKSYYLARC
jgi:hypothetical protein